MSLGTRPPTGTSVQSLGSGASSQTTWSTPAHLNCRHHPRCGIIRSILSTSPGGAGPGRGTRYTRGSENGAGSLEAPSSDPGNTLDEPHRPRLTFWSGNPTADKRMGKRVSAMTPRGEILTTAPLSVRWKIVVSTTQTSFTAITIKGGTIKSGLCKKIIQFI
ncbi:hypothetical protein EVAR_14988_1 [Eumeta japonica]|uniref:Uncharacterized protein n=1 Tax=Eumeta variegata TaxID=151549 RepID=A0A4C1X9T2_EUMVA|nr:hypothetical protein EVAR_14988_1 [Eumeta japonica]